jgi:hypothetical protein
MEINLEQASNHGLEGPALIFLKGSKQCYFIQKINFLISQGIFDPSFTSS